ncbi:5-hydroxytryptamine receptor [Stomoxys calcitrans]|uniref:5-hydroxytryptamine receptor n=1 Tax=Stomoxys calcitrans TaxID=35570 RepID=UPI0027E2D5CC|nr:5-hydroxytryptamine receptor [Stomoxys calcitrans]
MPSTQNLSKTVQNLMAFEGIFFRSLKKVLHNFISESSEGYQTPSQDSAPLDSGEPEDNSQHKHISSSDQIDESNESNESQYPGILDTDLIALTKGQKKVFIIIVLILCVISLIGNISTLVVNVRRKIRPFFRACLISLAFSDLLNTVFLSTAYLSQFMAEYVQIWSLGALMCNLVPFATTAAILASSMTLVGIAVDRYYAVMKAVVGFWQPTVICCFVCMLCIWLASLGIACPVFNIYDIMPVYILTQQTDTDVSGADAMTTARTTTETQWEIDASQDGLSYTLVREQKLVNMCVSDQRDVTLYYVIVFVLIFIPCIGAFFWFNTIIARKLWKRRHSATINRRPPPKPQTQNGNNTKAIARIQVPTTPTTSPCMELQSTNKRSAAVGLQPLQPQCQNCSCKCTHSTSTTMPSSLMGIMGGTATLTAASNAPPTTKGPVATNFAIFLPSSMPTRSSRESRHLRMFTIILLMMVVFVFLRLPAWIFLLMRMYGSYNRQIDWMLYFTFGIMNLTSSGLNPLLYTFLTETLQYLSRLKAKVTALICSCCCCCCCCCPGNGNKSTAADATMPNIIEEPRFALSCGDNFCGCKGFLRATWKCRQPNCVPKPLNDSQQRVELDSKSKESNQVAYNNDKDEGVDCSDVAEDDDEGAEQAFEFQHRIFAIYSSSLVSSSSQ